MDTIYQKVKDICSDKGVSIASIEKKAGMSNGSISKWELHQPSAFNLKKVANALEVPVSMFLE